MREKKSQINLNGNLIEGEYAPAREIKAHVELYKTFPGCMSIANTRSKNTAAFAQSCKSIPPMGTLHADYFHGTIPVTRLLTKEELGEILGRDEVLCMVVSDINIINGIKTLNGGA